MSKQVSELERKIAKNVLELAILKLDFDLYREQEAWKGWLTLDARKNLDKITHTLASTGWPAKAATIAKEMMAIVEVICKDIEIQDVTNGYTHHLIMQKTFGKLKDAVS